MGEENRWLRGKKVDLEGPGRQVKQQTAQSRRTTQVFCLLGTCWPHVSEHTLKNYSFKKYLFYFMCMCVPEDRYLYHVLQCQQRSEKGIGSPGTVVMWL